MKSTQNKTKIALLNLQPMTQLGIRAALAGAEPISEPYVAVQVNGLKTAQYIAYKESVRLVIIDPTQPTLSSGLAACRELAAQGRPPFILAFCGPLSDHEVMLCQISGIDSFVSAQESPDRLVDAVDTTMRGGRVWFLGRKPDANGAARHYQDVLTPREQEVLWMLIERYTNDHIAKELTISRNTVKNHVASVLRKLGVQQRSDLFGVNRYTGRVRGA